MIDFYLFEVKCLLSVEGVIKETMKFQFRVSSDWTTIVSSVCLSFSVSMNVHVVDVIAECNGRMATVAIARQLFSLSFISLCTQFVSQSVAGW